MYKMGKKSLSNEVIREQAKKAGFEEVSAFDNMEMAFMKGHNLVVVYNDGTIEGGTL